MLIGPDGVVIVDVTESYESGQEVFAAFRNITKKPVRAIIYTHNHADHTYGAKVCNIGIVLKTVILNVFQGRSSS